MVMDVVIRQENANDLPIILDLVKNAFDNVIESDHQEQCLVERLHHSETFIPELSLVAEDGNGTIVGYILLTEVKRSEERRVGKECRCRGAPGH